MNLDIANPAYLFGLLGMSIPVMVHLLTRRHQTHIKFSAIYLLKQAQKRSIKRARPNRLWLLLIRCLAIAFLSLALANPIFSFGGPEELISSKPSANVYILDDSYSMGRKAQQGSVFDEAARVLGSLIEHMPATSSHSLILASGQADVLQDWTEDRKRITKRLKTLAPSHQTTSIGRALTQAQEMLTSAPQKIRRVYLLTDLDKNGWKPDEFSDLLAKMDKLKVLDFSSERTEPNRALIEDVEASQEFLSQSRVIRVKTRLRNLHSDRPLNNMKVSLWVADKRISESLIDLPPNTTTDKHFSFPLQTNDMIHGRVEIEADGLMEDNQRMFSYQPDHKLKVLLVDGDPRGVAHQNETFYLERALNPFSSATADMEPVVSTLAELPQRDLYQFSVIILSNVRELPIDFEKTLEQYVMRGGALFIGLGDQINPRFYNERLSNLLPVTLQAIHHVQPDEEPFHLQMDPTNHPALKVFSDETLKEMELIRFNTIYRVEPRTNRSFIVPMRLSNQLPALVESELGRGKILLFVSSFDRDWNTFPIQPTFLPWVQRWVQYSAKSLESITRGKLLVGETIEFESGENPLAIETPDHRLVQLKSEAGTDTRFEETGEPGTYILYRLPLPDTPSPVTENKILSQLPAESMAIGTFTINIDTRESEPGTMTQRQIEQFLPDLPLEITHDPGQWRGTSDDPGVPLTTPFFLLVALFLCVEGWMVRKE